MRSAPAETFFNFFQPPRRCFAYACFYLIFLWREAAAEIVTEHWSLADVCQTDGRACPPTAKWKASAMPSGHALGRGPILIKTPSWRQQAGRRRLAVVLAVLALALASGLVGALIHPVHAISSRPATGPFSYIPPE
jgi:hypothetical protein